MAISSMRYKDLIKEEAAPKELFGMPCSRMDGLAEMDMHRQDKAEWRDCMNRRNRPGYAKVKDVKLNGGEK